ncbi:hypothetical protein C1I95_23655 [Micromonospora craterilacus]|uniref:Uncharacterized protein n=1 Tax=Micromonospora craterilacus TaxID=1655439 RepID=A0A2W2DNI1_9ACTN|nr:hypothetical protein C1I95_23655 [Micromonospora craterilacus]
MAVTEFHRTAPGFWDSIAHMLTAAQAGAAAGDAVAALMPSGVNALKVLPLTTGEAIVQVDTGDDVRLIAGPFSRSRLTPSVNGIDAASEALAVIAAEVSTVMDSYRTQPR